jgi:hypothetical protein
VSTWQTCQAGQRLPRRVARSEAEILEQWAEDPQRRGGHEHAEGHPLALAGATERRQFEHQRQREVVGRRAGVARRALQLLRKGGDLR